MVGIFYIHSLLNKKTIHYVCIDAFICHHKKNNKPPHDQIDQLISINQLHYIMTPESLLIIHRYRIK